MFDLKELDGSIPLIPYLQDYQLSLPLEDTNSSYIKQDHVHHMETFHLNYVPLQGIHN